MPSREAPPYQPSCDPEQQVEVLLGDVGHRDVHLLHTGVRDHDVDLAELVHPKLIWLPLVDAEPNVFTLIWLKHSANPMLHLLLEQTRQTLQPLPAATN